MASKQAVKRGDLVVAADGQELGKVKGVLETCFKVAVPRGRDYWLANDAVLGRGKKIALLRFERKNLDDARITTDEHVGAHAHPTSGRSRGFLVAVSRLLMFVSLGVMAFRNKERLQAAGQKAVDTVKPRRAAAPPPDTEYPLQRSPGTAADT